MSRVPWEKLKSLSGLLAAPVIDEAEQAERLRFMERDIGVLVRGTVLAVLFYYLFLSDWFEGLNTIGKVALETVQRFFLVYAGINLGAAGVYLFMDRLPFTTVRWVAVIVNFIDGLFIGVVTLATGGLESLAYWVFLVLMARNALTFPVASIQLGLNLAVLVSYLLTGLTDRMIAGLEQSTIETLARLASTEPERLPEGKPSLSASTNVVTVYTNAAAAYTRGFDRLARVQSQYTNAAAQLTNASAEYSRYGRSPLPAEEGVVSAELARLDHQHAAASRVYNVSFRKYVGTFARYTNAVLHYTNALERYTSALPGTAEVLIPATDVLSQLAACTAQYTNTLAGHAALARMARRETEDWDNPYPVPLSAIGMSERELRTEYLLLRLVLMLFVAACCYGLQVLVDKQRLAQEEAREASLRQEQLRAAGRLAAQIAHQVKNPLAIINNAAFSLQRAAQAGLGPPPQQIQMIREEVERADRIVTKLMGYAQLAEGRVEKLKLADELDQALAEVFPPAAHYEVQIQKDYARPLPPLFMQRGHLREILVNVLLNAREAVNGHGRIRIAARPTPGDALEVAISDDGPGIAPDCLERVFEPYYTTKEKGTGLGLAIVKQDVQMYGGRVQVQSELGKGATIILHLPTKTVMKEPI
jgi:signal transduction histidine kinase